MTYALVEFEKKWFKESAKINITQSIAYMSKASKEDGPDNLGRSLPKVAAQLLSLTLPQIMYFVHQLVHSFFEFLLLRNVFFLNI